jgi:hypothetical protein
MVTIADGTRGKRWDGWIMWREEAGKVGNWQWQWHTMLKESRRSNAGGCQWQRGNMMGELVKDYAKESMFAFSQNRKDNL